jgi:hypothetical protein
LVDSDEFPEDEVHHISESELQNVNQSANSDLKKGIFIVHSDQDPNELSILPCACSVIAEEQESEFKLPNHVCSHILRRSCMNWVRHKQRKKHPQ